MEQAARAIAFCTDRFIRHFAKPVACTFVAVDRRIPGIMRVPVAIYRQRKHKPPDTDVDTMDNIGSYTDIRSFEKCKCISICVTIPDKGQIKGGMSMKCKFCGNDLPEES